MIMSAQFRKSHFVQIQSAMFLCVCLLVICSCTRTNLQKEEKIAQMTDAQLMDYYHGLSERIKNMDMQHRIDRELNPTFSEHRILQDQAIGGKIYRLDQTRKMILKEMKKRNIDDLVKSRSN